VEVPAFVTNNTPGDGSLSIGELSRLTGVSVRTIRFYCDEGILEPRRSSGGHRLFDPATAVGQLQLVRRLRALGLGLTAIIAILTGTTSIAEAVAAQRAALDSELGALAWRRAALVAVEDAPPADRAARLESLASVYDRHSAYDHLVAFWQGLLTFAPAGVLDAFVAMNIPAPPPNPGPGQIVAYAELVTATADPALASALTHQLWRSDPAGIHDKRQLLTGVAEACAVVAPLVTAHIEPRPGAELDQFRIAHAAARRERDTPGFRQRILNENNNSDPRIHRYWELTTALTGTTTAGAALEWLYQALKRSAAPMP
jgi:DNA-binding transcriptional MerR regulator